MDSIWGDEDGRVGLEIIRDSFAEEIFKKESKLSKSFILFGILWNSTKDAFWRNFEQLQMR